jgi:hypothetical protein
MGLRVLVLTACFLWTASAFSQDAPEYPIFKTGDDLFQDCSAPPGAPELAICSGYVLGVSDALEMLKVACPPLNATPRQVVDVVTNYLNDHPKTRRYAAAGEATLALRQAFPCK